MLPTTENEWTAMNAVLQEATQFVARCYGCATSKSMSSARYEVWLSKTSKRKTTGAPKLQSLPNIRSVWAKCETGILPTLHLERGLRKGPSWPATNRFRLGKRWRHEIPATSNSSRGSCTCPSGCSQTEKVWLCDWPAMCHYRKCEHVPVNLILMPWSFKRSFNTLYDAQYCIIYRCQMTN